jgi:hypothetical protein
LTTAKKNDEQGDQMSLWKTGPKCGPLCFL